MPYQISQRAEKVSPSSTLAITARAKKLKAEGKDIINFGAGEPDFDTPDFVKEKAIEAIKSGFTKYTPTTGIPELKSAISEKFKKDNLLDYSNKQIIVSCGAKHSIFNTLLALINPGDEVLIPVPYWVSYPEMVYLCEGKVNFIQTKKENNFKITAGELKRNINAKTKLLIINSPSNPSGSVYRKEELQQIADICTSKKIYVISDEIYEKLIYDDLKYFSLASFNQDIYDLTITINGLSKAYSMTGWRIGYLGAPLEISEAIARIQDHSTSNPTSIAQKAAVAALLASGNFTESMRLEFQKRRDCLISRVNKILNLNYIKPEGAFYMFLDISQTKLKSLEFSQRLLDEKGVALIPGEAFGNDKYVRISFATSLEQIEEGMDRLAEWIRQL